MGVPRPICVPCGREMHPEQNGCEVQINAVFGPYEIWSGDKWKCPTCGTEIVVGFGFKPMASHFESGFDAYRKNVNVIVKHHTEE